MPSPRISFHDETRALKQAYGVAQDTTPFQDETRVTAEAYGNEQLPLPVAASAGPHGKLVQAMLPFTVSKPFKVSPAVAKPCVAPRGRPRTRMSRQSWLGETTKTNLRHIRPKQTVIAESRENRVSDATGGRLPAFAAVTASTQVGGTVTGATHVPGRGGSETGRDAETPPRPPALTNSWRSIRPKESHTEQHSAAPADGATGHAESVRVDLSLSGDRCATARPTDLNGDAGSPKSAERAETTMDLEIGNAVNNVRLRPVRPREVRDGGEGANATDLLTARFAGEQAVGRSQHPQQIEIQSTMPSAPRKRSRRSEKSQAQTKRVRPNTRGVRTLHEQQDDLATVMQALEDEHAVKERLSNEQTWCTPISDERKVSTVRAFYRAFHDSTTLPIQTCTVCYRKRSENELHMLAWDKWVLSSSCAGGRPVFNCSRCFPERVPVLICAECSRYLRRGCLSPAAQLHSRLACEHAFPEELKGLTPVEEKLISLNSCYGFLTRCSVNGNKQGTHYPKHVKGHITVFPNNVQELVSKVLPHPLLQAMDEIHVSWHGVEKPAPSDLSSLLAVRRPVVERALLWLKRNNPHYADIEINTAEMESWGNSAHGVPSLVYDRLERNEPSAWEKTRTAHIVPPAERAMDDEEAIEIDELLDLLNQGQNAPCRQAERMEEGAEGADENDFDEHDSARSTINEVVCSGMFALDGAPDVPDEEKLRFACEAVRRGSTDDRPGPRAWIGRSAEAGTIDDGYEPYIQVCRGADFADSFDASFFPKTFPTLFPFGFGGPRLVEEASAQPASGSGNGSDALQNLLSSRNMSLRTWTEAVLRRHGGRFATHHVFAFLVFNMGVRSRNRRVSMLSVTRKNFPKVERVVRSLTVDRLAIARAELERSGKTADSDVNELLRSLSLYGYRQPMSRELRLSMRHKIQALIVRYGVPAIWFTINPNDITNPVKLRLAAYRTRNAGEAERFLRDLDKAFKRVRLSISDPMSSAIFFHREISMFFEHYVKVGEESVFGRISQYYGAVETNERGALHVHGLLWLQGNAHLSSMLADVDVGDAAAYNERIVQYIDSVFCEVRMMMHPVDLVHIRWRMQASADVCEQELDQEGYCAAGAERSVTTDISPLMDHDGQFSAAFEEEANFCAGATQIHTHSPTCLKYSVGKKGPKGGLCRFKAPWRLVEKTSLTPDGVLQIRRTHPMVNRWNKAMAVGLRHNHDISFIATQKKTMALVYYVTNYATKVEDPTWKRAAAAAELLPVISGDDQLAGEDRRAGDGAPAGNTSTNNKTRRFLMRVANRVFTERPLSQVEVIAHLLRYPSEFTNTCAWAYLNASVLYWYIFHRWDRLREESSAAAEEEPSEEAVIVEESGHRISFLDAYDHRGDAFRNVCLYDYVSVVRLQRISTHGRPGKWGEVPFESSWLPGRDWVQVLRRPRKHATVCLDGYLSKDFEQDEDGACHRR